VHRCVVNKDTRHDQTGFSCRERRSGPDFSIKPLATPANACKRL